MARKKKNKFLMWQIVSITAFVVIACYFLLGQKNSNSTISKITKDAAVTEIESRPEVIEYLKEVPRGTVAVSGEENDSYLIQVYETVNGHTATFNWYKVDKTTGEVKKDF